MTLESLSNELLIELFEFLNTIDLLRAFLDLNTRFNSLLLTNPRIYYVDLQSISREDFEIFYQTYLPLITNQIIHFRLSDDADTPRQYDHLLSVKFKLSQLNRLRSVTFNNISSEPMINQFFFHDLSQLHQLTHLKFVNCPLFEVEKHVFQDIINRIWSLPKLTYCYWDHRCFYIPTIISTSLHNLIIRKNYWSSYEFTSLLEKTPNLRKFSISLDSYEEDDRPSARQFIPSPNNVSVEKLVLYEVRSQRVMTNLFQLLPNIRHLKVEMFSIHLTGHDWEQIIIKYLPKLKVFQLKMDLNFSDLINNQDNEKRVEQYIATYRTPFWIEYHQWFIRCHWSLSMKSLHICIYTLPYQFDYFPVYPNVYNSKTISTYSRGKYFSYDSVQQINYGLSLFEDDTWSYIQLNNIRILHLHFPIDLKFFSIIPNIDHLRILTVEISTRSNHLQLQALLDRAWNLHLLVFDSWNSLEMPPYQLTSASIRRLDLQGVDQSRCRHYYNLQQCIELSQSPLARQCRVLLICVKDIQSILILINSMINLRTLHVIYEDDRRGNRYDLLELLKNYLSSSWTVNRYNYGHWILQS